MRDFLFNWRNLRTKQQQQQQQQQQQRDSLRKVRLGFGIKDGTMKCACKQILRAHCPINTQNLSSFSYLVIPFHIFHCFSQLFKCRSIIWIFFPTLHHDFIPELFGGTYSQAITHYFLLSIAIEKKKIIYRLLSTCPGLAILYPC